MHGREIVRERNRYIEGERGRDGEREVAKAQCIALRGR